MIPPGSPFRVLYHGVRRLALLIHEPQNVVLAILISHARNSSPLCDDIGDPEPRSIPSCNFLLSALLRVFKRIHVHELLVHGARKAARSTRTQLGDISGAIRGVPSISASSTESAAMAHDFISTLLVPPPTLSHCPTAAALQPLSRHLLALHAVRKSPSCVSVATSGVATGQLRSRRYCGGKYDNMGPS